MAAEVAPNPPYPFDKKLVGPQNGQWRRAERNIFAATGLELRPLGCAARSQWWYPLSYRGSRLLFCIH
jgi:hypothetical protein